MTSSHLFFVYIAKMVMYFTCNTQDNAKQRYDKKKWKYAIEKCFSLWGEFVYLYVYFPFIYTQLWNGWQFLLRVKLVSLEK